MNDDLSFLQQESGFENEIAEAVHLLQELVKTPSFSRNEENTADILESFLTGKGVEAKRFKKNVWACNKNFEAKKPTLLLNSHHDTVRPAAGYTTDPFSGEIRDEKLCGLGSNDAGGCLVSLLTTFVHFYDADLPFNLVFAASAEEEVSGRDGIEALLLHLPAIQCAIVGEPTLMKMAVAERGLLVLDCVAEGVTGHAARNEGTNAIDAAISDILWFHTYQFEKISAHLGPVKMTVTSIETQNKAHNVVPDTCNFIVDVRVPEQYDFAEIIRVITENVGCKVQPRSTRLKPSSIDPKHPLVLAGRSLGLETYGSPTMSDMALMPFPAIKLGPGDSARSHSADEFIFVHEIEEGIHIYCKLIEELVLAGLHLAIR